MVLALLPPEFESELKVTMSCALSEPPDSTSCSKDFSSLEEALLLVLLALLVLLELVEVVFVEFSELRMDEIEILMSALPQAFSPSHATCIPGDRIDTISALGIDQIPRCLAAMIVDVNHQVLQEGLQVRLATACRAA